MRPTSEFPAKPEFWLYCQIRLLHRERGLNFAQIALELHLDEETVAKWAWTKSYTIARTNTPRKSKLDRHQDIENPDHAKELLSQRTKPRNAKVLLAFYALCPRADEYYRQLQERRCRAELKAARRSLRLWVMKPGYHSLESYPIGRRSRFLGSQKARLQRKSLVSPARVDMRKLD